MGLNIIQNFVEESRIFVQFHKNEKMLEILPEVRRISAEWNDLISKDIPDEEIEKMKTIGDVVEFIEANK